MSLLGQLYWREHFYLIAAVTPQYGTMHGNPMCRIIDWCDGAATSLPRSKTRGSAGFFVISRVGARDENEEHLRAWESGRTGFPWIDAAMTQLRTQGWIHHLARHSPLRAPTPCIVSSRTVIRAACENRRLAWRRAGDR